MGIGKGTFPLLVELSTRFQPRGRSVMLGRQRFNLGPEMKRRGARAARPYDRALATVKPGVSAASLVQEDNFSERLFETLGFGGIEALDYSDYEGATLRWDLNTPVPPEWHGAFSFIFDGGTIEHLFNVPQAFRNIFDMLEPGGRFVGLNPYNGYPSHGMYQFAPELIWTYWQHGCGCKVHACKAVAPRGSFVRDMPDPTVKGGRLVVKQGPVSLGYFPFSRVMLWYEVEKLESSAPPQGVQQSDYASEWARAAQGGGA